MKYVNLNATVSGLTEVISPTAYLQQLAELGPALPAGPRRFATDEQH